MLPSKDVIRIRYFGTRCSFQPDVDGLCLPEAILSGHGGAVHRLCIPACYLPYRPSTVDTWLRSPRVKNLQVLEFYYMFPRFVGKTITLPHEFSSSAPSPPTSTLLFSSSLHTVTFSLCQIPDKYAESFKLPLLKRLWFLEVDISDVSLQIIINHGCPALEWLLLVCNNLDDCIRINSAKVELICILCENGELVVEDAPSLKRLIHDIQSRQLQITVFSASKLECLGNFYERFPESKIVFGSTVIEALSVVSLSVAVQSVKTLLIHMSLNLDKVVALMRFFPSLENLFIEGGVCREEGVTNKWRHKHREFLKQHDIRLNTVKLEQYVHCKKNIEFATFFILNAKELETMRLKFLSPPDNITEGFYEHQEEVLQWGNKASRSARLILSGLDFQLELYALSVSLSGTCFYALQS
ncbi:uncharacterized protein [Aegilops tauschii subsp. strangulata]|uniref:uncharacterized protein n=1 Tax=Aegilops tauschii subsp. strangulata TaxID=200361 RepID=UPI003CC8B49D